MSVINFLEQITFVRWIRLMLAAFIALHLFFFARRAPTNWTLGRLLGQCKIEIKSLGTFIIQQQKQIACTVILIYVFCSFCFRRPWMNLLHGSEVLACSDYTLQDRDSLLSREGSISLARYAMIENGYGFILKPFTHHLYHLPPMCLSSVPLRHICVTPTFKPKN